ncbi:CBS domain-containing protein [Streptomyces sp. NRRL S-87]|uniref:CBS domain-containing protein n=1 Tax=Streptomyces sp. NRRL S-87 TaxID=1463920 RepID=UPI00069017D2|nr:CBS domain-containing protein [Streptomyces sp. NRRL S-87]
MQHVKVADLMTDDVVSVAPETPVKDVAKVLAQHDITGVPVLDEEDRVLGIVSQTDLLARVGAAGAEGAVPTGSRQWPDGSGPRWPAGTGPEDPAAGQGSAVPSPVTARELMSAPAVTVHADEPAADAARLMTRRGVERLPVVDVEDRLVGIVTRRDLLRLFLRPDAEIRHRVEDDVLSGVLGAPADAVEVHVVDGIVTLTGRLDRTSQLPVLRHLVEQVDGVVAVASRVTARTDDAPAAPTVPTRHAMPW